MLVHVDGTTDGEVAQKTVGPLKCDVNTLTVHLLESRPHEPKSIMANVQRKLKKKYEEKTEITRELKDELNYI